MIICICNNVNSETIKQAVSSGANTVDTVKEQTGAAGCCGKCQFKVNRVIQDHIPEALQETACL